MFLSFFFLGGGVGGREELKRAMPKICDIAFKVKIIVYNVYRT